MNRLLPVISALILSLAPAISFGDIIYDMGTPSRPIGFANLVVNSVVYNGTITYDNNAQINPLRVGDLPDSDIELAVSALLADLNDELIDSNLSAIYLQPNVDTFTLSPSFFQVKGRLLDNRVGVNDWTGLFFAGDSQSSGPLNTGPSFGFAQFSIATVPEPSCAGLLSTCCSIAVLCQRRKRS